MSYKDICKRRFIKKTVNVDYIFTCDHKVSIANAKFQPIPPTMKKDIKNKLSTGVSVNDIYKEIRDNHANHNSRENIDNNVNINKSHLIKKSVIKDMERQLKYRRRLHPEDSTSTYLLIKKLDLEKYNPVILYKTQGEKYLITPQKYKENDEKSKLFAIEIQTKEQHEMFVKHSFKITCIDATHGTNHYGFPLISLIPNDFGKGYPVGHYSLIDQVRAC